MTNIERGILIKHVIDLENVPSCSASYPYFALSTRRGEEYNGYPYTIVAARSVADQNTLLIVLDTPVNPNNHIKLTVRPGQTLIEALHDFPQEEVNNGELDR